MVLLPDERFGAVLFVRLPQPLLQGIGALPQLADEAATDTDRAKKVWVGCVEFGQFVVNGSSMGRNPVAAWCLPGNEPKSARPVAFQWDVQARYKLRDAPIGHKCRGVLNVGVLNVDVLYALR